MSIFVRDHIWLKLLYKEAFLHIQVILLEPLEQAILKFLLKI